LGLRKLQHVRVVEHKITRGEKSPHFKEGLKGMNEKRNVPEIVSIVALGSSKQAFLTETMTTGNPRGVADEVWVVNKMGSAIRHDLLWRMDDLKVKYGCNDREYSGGNTQKGTTIHDTWDNFLRNHDRPIVTSRAYQDEYPTSIEYPLEDVINTIGYSYFRTTPAYAAAFAIHIGVKQLRIYGCDYVYPSNKYKAESGRANLEFILGIGMTMGMEVWVPPTTTLLDSMSPTQDKMYGYIDPVEVKPDPENPDRWKVTFLPEVGKKMMEDQVIEERKQLQSLITKYKDGVKHDLIEGKWITKDDIDEHFKQKQLLDAPLRDGKGRFKKKESQKENKK
jgi:hypothetical protein